MSSALPVVIYDEDTAREFRMTLAGRVVHNLDPKARREAACMFIGWNVELHLEPGRDTVAVGFVEAVAHAPNSGTTDLILLTVAHLHARPDPVHRDLARHRAFDPHHSEGPVTASCKGGLPLDTRQWQDDASHELFKTTEPAAWVEHMRTVHHRSPGSGWVFDADTKSWKRRRAVAALPVRRWRAPKRTDSWQPKPFEVGAVVDWVHYLSYVGGPGPIVIRGQVWSGHPAAHTRWVVSDGIAYDVREGQLVENWIADRKRAHRRVIDDARLHRSHRNCDMVWRPAARQIREEIYRILGLVAELDHEARVAA